MGTLCLKHGIESLIAPILTGNAHYLEQKYKPPIKNAEHWLCPSCVTVTIPFEILAILVQA